jgi:DNA-binding NtrC family response regulator
MATGNRQRVLVMSRNSEMRHELVTLLSGYGYYVEESQSRVDGVRKFRAHKQPIIILDMPMLRLFPRRLIDFFQKVRKNTIVLVAAHKREEDDAYQYLRLGAYDLLNLPLKTDSLKLTLNRALTYHQAMLDNVFIGNALFFGLLMLPIWAALAYVLSR